MKKKTTLFTPIFWSIMAVWWTYRLLSNLTELKTQKVWITIGDIVFVVGWLLLAVFWWIMFIKSKKDDARKDENGKE